MTDQLRREIFQQLDELTLVDPHTHINPHQPASESLADILGYHYYTELVHSAGMAKGDIEDRRLSPKERVGRLIENLDPISNTIQYSWLIEIARTFFGFDSDRVTTDNWELLYDSALIKMNEPDWADKVLQTSRLAAVFLTNDFDDRLTGFDTNKYIPCLRTDDLVFHLTDPSVRERLDSAAGQSVGSVAELREALGRLFEHFHSHGAKACAISLPPDFSPVHITSGRAETAFDQVWKAGTESDLVHQRALSSFIFWTIAEYCSEFRLPFDLMIGVNRRVYPGGVFQGQDLYDSRVSLIQYAELFNAFPQVTFPVSVLASVTNQELTSYAWIFPNVITQGHWWYSNTPTFIENDCAARLEAVPQTKQIGYYSDMYKLEFGLPKFKMYKRVLAKILAQRWVGDRGWSEQRAVALGKRLLRDNVERVFQVTSDSPR